MVIIYVRNLQLKIFVSSFKTNVLPDIFMTVIENTKVELLYVSNVISVKLEGNVVLLVG